MLSEFASTLKDIFFPALCFACEAKIPSGFVCRKCLEKIIYMRPPMCRLCSKPLGASKTGVCRDCRGRDVYFDRTICVAAYKEPLAGLIHSFKYARYDYLAPFFSDLMSQHLQKIGFQPARYTLATGVPIHRLKRKGRGYNQAALLGLNLAKYFKIPFRDDIIYTRQLRASQTKVKAGARAKNALDAFESSAMCTNEDILLVDDVFTTGATVNACAKALKAGGARSVTVVTLTKTLK